MVSTLHSLYQECIRKFLGQHYIKDQPCAEHWDEELDQEFQVTKQNIQKCDSLYPIPN